MICLSTRVFPIAELYEGLVMKEIECCACGIAIIDCEYHKVDLMAEVEERAKPIYNVVLDPSKFIRALSKADEDIDDAFPYEDYIADIINGDPVDEEYYQPS
jgi:hypothetical protein